MYHPCNDSYIENARLNVFARAVLDHVMEVSSQEASRRQANSVAAWMIVTQLPKLYVPKLHMLLADMESEQSVI